MIKGTKAHKDAIKLNREMDRTNRADGRAGSSVFQFSQPGAGGPGGDDPKTAVAKSQGREVGEMNKSSKFHPDNKGRERGAESGFKKTERTEKKESKLGLKPTVTERKSTKKDGKWVRTTTAKADNPEAKEKHEYLLKEGKFKSDAQARDYAKKHKPFAQTITKQATKKGKKTFTAAEGEPKYMTKTKVKKDGTVKTKRKRHRKNVFKNQPGVKAL